MSGEAKSIKKNCIILSQGPVPTPEHTKVEGGGLRCWGLAKGIVANDPDLDVTVAYHESYKTDDFAENFEGVHIATWDFDSVSELIKDYDSILVSYCMGQLPVQVVNAIRPDQQLILDCYVPIYVEVSARGSANVDEEYHAFEHDVRNWDHVLKRGDLFLCANEPQKDFYRGVLAAVGRINPVTYAEELILTVPYGVYRDEPKANEKPIAKMIGNGKEDEFLKVLWFGGIYPWFDVRKLADAVKEVNKTVPAKLIVVGAKNPFNKHPDFIARYDEFIEHVSSDEMKKFVLVQDWISFNDRADWYLDADVVVVFNKEGEENKLAWRTRLVDFMWADLPVLTNGGDPLGEIMIENHAAVRMDSIEPGDIAKSIVQLGQDHSKISELKNNMNKLKTNFFWDTVTAQLTKAIQEGERALDLATMGIFEPNHGQTGKRSLLPVGKVVSKAKKVPAYANKYGYRTTGKVIKEMVNRKVTAKAKLKGRTEPAYVFVSHQLDMSGAPFIAVDMALDFKAAGKPVEFYTYLPAHHDNLVKLNKAGIKPHVLMNKDMVPSFIAGDTVILNTVAHSEIVKEAMFKAAERGVIKQLLWYLHEDDPELLFRSDEQKRIKKLLQKNRIKLLIAAVKMRQNYIKYFETEENIVLLPYRHIVPKKYHKTLKQDDFDHKLTFVLPGTVGDGRKGQLPILYACLQFYEKYYKPNPELYRDFELIFIGISDDFLSRQILAHAGGLDEHFSHHGRVTWKQDLDIVSKCNITICYSIRECLPLFVFEGMISGHPVLRNNSSGMEEQLLPGKNGMVLESDDFNQVVDTLETVLNKQKTSNKTLADMSEVSHNIARKYEDNNYLGSVDGA